MPPFYGELRPGAERALQLTARNQERPPPDWYDKFPSLVAPHFCQTPALVSVAAVYTKYGNEHQKAMWPAVVSDAKARAQRIYRHYGLAWNARYKCGLYIAGNETEVAEPYRDRMMVLVFELSRDEIQFWKDIHTDAMKLLEDLGLTGKHGVCVRYYSRVERRGDRIPDNLIIADNDDNHAADQSGSSARLYQEYLRSTAQRDQAFQRWNSQREEAFRQAEQLQARAQRERQERYNGTYDSGERSVSLYSAANALATLARFEAGGPRTPPPPPGLDGSRVPIARLLARAEANRSTQSSGQSGGEHLTSINRIIDFYNTIANPAQRDTAREDFYDPDSGTDLTDRSVAGSDKEDEPLLPFDYHTRDSLPALEFR